MTPSNDVAIKSLAKYLKEELPNVQILDDWPDPKVTLAMPTISIIAVGKRDYTHHFPQFWKKSVNPENANLDDVVYRVGQYDFTLQLDLWCEYKAQRGELYELVHDALNKEFLNQDRPAGLSLVLDDYYDLIARFDQSGYTYLDSEENSQRSEWRVKIDVLVNHSKLTVKTQSRIAEITVTEQIADTVNVEEDNTNAEEIIVIGE
jgi:hypothetical protein